jgi:hypothetical protein
MDRDELDRRILLIKELLDKDMLKIASKDTIESLKKVRVAADGKVDPATVDSSVRALAGVVDFVNYRDQLKQISIRDIQGQYFSLLEEIFGNPFREMQRHNLSPSQIARSMAANPKLVKALRDEADEFNESIMEFWRLAGPAVEVFVQDYSGLKAVYGGDIFPPYNDGILSRTGLYVDLVVLPDPLLRVAPLLKTMTPESATYYLAKHALSALALKDLILADIDPPLAVIAPDYFILDESAQSYVRKVGESDSLMHLEHLFGIDCESVSLDAFLGSITNIDQLKIALKDPSRLLFDTDWRGLPLRKQLELLEKINDEFEPLNDTGMTLGERIRFAAMGRMMQANDLVFKSDRLVGVPIIDAPTSWQYLIWKYEYDTERSREFNDDLNSTFLVNSLQDDEFQWLGNVPINSIISLRKNGALSDLRSILNKAVGNISTASEKVYIETVNNIVSELNIEFYKHSKELVALASQNKKFYGFEVSSSLLVGGIGIASAVSGNIPLSAAAAMLGWVGLPSPRELWRKGKELIKEKHDLKRSPVGLLFEAKHKSA